MNITKEYLEDGYRVSQMIVVCKKERALLCLFGKKTDIPKDCWQNCEFAKFRIAFESDSPVFWAEFLKLSDAHRRIHNYIGGEIEEVSFHQRYEANVELEELKNFVLALYVAFYPAFLDNGSEFPFLTLEEIEKEKKSFFEEGIDLTAQEMRKIDKVGWLDQICYRLGGLRHVQEYANAVFLLVRLFLKGIRKEEEELFHKIEVSCQKGG